MEVVVVAQEVMAELVRDGKAAPAEILIASDGDERDVVLLGQDA